MSWLKKASESVFGHDSNNVQLDQQLLEYLTEDLNDYLIEELSKAGLKTPETIPLVSKAMINYGQDEDLPRTEIETKQTDGLIQIKVSNLIVCANYPMALLNPIHDILIRDANNICEQQGASYEALIKIKMTPLQTRQDDDIFVLIDIPSINFFPDLEEDTIASADAMKFDILKDHEELENNAIDFCFDKNLDSETIMIVEYIGELTQEQQETIEDIIRLELPDRITGTPIKMRQITADDNALKQALCSKTPTLRL